MHWLGLDWDGDAVSQAARAPRHAEVAHEMLARGHAYKCFFDQEEIEAFSRGGARRRPLHPFPQPLARRAETGHPTCRM